MDCVIPKKYRRTYERAMTGKSCKSAIRCACLRCCNWRAGDVRKCQDAECPLFLYRPRARIFLSASGTQFLRVESTNSENPVVATVKTQNEAKSALKS